jgi:hypothetical protein
VLQTSQRLLGACAHSMDKWRSAAWDELQRVHKAAQGALSTWRYGMHI